MHDYSWMKTAQAPQVTGESARHFLANNMADMHERYAVEWAAKGDQVQAERWAKSAASLRGEA